METKPLPSHATQPSLVKLGMICGREIYAKLDGDMEAREYDYRVIIELLRKEFYPPKED